MNNLKTGQDRVFYQVYLPSFCDGNADGLGDFQGLISKLDYLADLGIGGIWITPFYPSQLVDNGYDISDHCDVDPRFGTLDLFDELIAACHQRDILLVIDVVMNHVSDQHPWFQAALRQPDSPFRDFFFFRETTNNWTSFFGGSAWTQEPGRTTCYYHKFSPQQVCLNWSNPAVEQEIKKILDFWIARHVDGFRFDVINFLTTDGIGEDHHPVEADEEPPHEKDINQPGVLNVVRRLCHHIRTHGEFLLIGEVGSEVLPVMAPYQGAGLLDVVFNFNLGSQKVFDIEEIFAQLQAMETLLPGLPTLFFSSHDMPRMISRFGESSRDIRRAVAVFALQMTARGLPFIFQGEEIGMTDLVPQNLQQMRDIQGVTQYHTAISQGMNDKQALTYALPFCRDASRLPVPWTPADAREDQINAESESECSQSILNLYKALINIRNIHPSLQRGDYQFLRLFKQCLIFRRSLGAECVEVMINFGPSVINTGFGDGNTVLFGPDEPLLEKNHILIKKVNHENAQK
ncbi:glucohydrolase [Rahnella sp. C60]|uniref:alpha-amylase family glycosyl hydrolase n=1 Tax=Rahnella perminowiae TaxID=2816244 RepID=UPI001C25BA2F|nr:alpha-amylase family glycosyl hydrolase [Rahnella perminowiae]MBU9814299.1 glucohydrolase [Rahnella perminowiae]